MKKLDLQQQAKIVLHVEDTHSTFKDEMQDYKDRMLDIYKAIATFKQPKTKDWETAFKVNKAFEIENKVLPRIIANKPKWIVSMRTDEFDEGDMDLPVEQLAEKRKQVNMYVNAIRDYLSSIFTQDYIEEIVKLWVKNTVRYGVGWVKVCYRYDIKSDIYEGEEVEYDEEGNEIKTTTKKSKQEVLDESPSIELNKWTDVYYDPRYVRLEDMPAILEVKEGVRLSYFTKNPKKYMNIDKLIEINGLDDLDSNDYKEKVRNIAGINVKETGKINLNNLTVKKYYGRFELGDKANMDGSGEKLYEFRTINDMLLVYAEEIAFIPFEAIKCFEDTETFFATGFLEPILGLQDELNFKKNSASLYINQALNRNWVWSPNSGIDPRQLTSAPGNIITTNNDVETAMNNLQEIPFRELPANFFQEQNDFERQIQGLSFTIDTSTQQNNQALTNTATGIKVKAFESNSVVEMIRSNLERGLERLAYKLLTKTFENLENNKVIKKLEDDGFREINKEAMRDAVRRYSIKIEAGSTSFDTVETRRNDAIAQWNIGLQASQSGVPVDLKQLYIQLAETFEGVDVTKLIQQQPIMQGMMPPQGGGGKPIPMQPGQEDAGALPV